MFHLIVNDSQLLDTIQWTATMEKRFNDARTLRDLQIILPMRIC